MTSPGGGDSDDKVVVDTVEMETTSQPRIARSERERGGHRESPIMLGRGTREQLPIAPVPTPLRATRESVRDRDPIEVLRMWPHSLNTREAAAAAAPATSAAVAASGHAARAGDPGDPGNTASAASAPGNRVDDKVALAHLAIELFRELGKLEADIAAAHAGVPVCTNQLCEARINALRGGLIEACLLVQRVAMDPVSKGEAEDHVRELLELIDL